MSELKIYILKTDSKLQPPSQPFKYPVHNKDYSIEQDFLQYLLNNNELVTEEIDADWHYLPVFWTRWHLSHEYGKTGVTELQSSVDSAIINDKKTFTVCQYDDGPIVNLGDSKLFLSSRKTVENYDAPLLSSPHKHPFYSPRKKYLASFAGRISTHSIRQKMYDTLKNDNRFFLLDGAMSEKLFVKTILKSYVSLSPRGYGGSSFRFYESMQLGVVPFLIGDIDTRPFKKLIPWQELSFYTDKPESIALTLEQAGEKVLLELGKNCKSFYKEKLDFQKWCSYLINELKSL